MIHWNSETICTVFNLSQLPPAQLPEVVFVGRSNVGKSTLINALLNRLSKKVAFVSSKPGKTRSLNFYKIHSTGKECGEREFCIVDMPGYGYASRSKDERAGWWRLVEGYFHSMRDIVFVVHLIDFRHGPQTGDVELTAWMDELDMPRLIVFTKGDKTPHGRAKVFYRQYVESGLVSVVPPVVTSGRNDAVMDGLRVAILQIIDEFQVKI
ncbi:MAG: ribosome biogenesis GTP-binding protein YihA/YsxC [Synergistaceae bacterium]|nr:ribosome biogenesis GTP-binding protein YihA/YsxC [Synergistaceae bacterium]